MIADNARRRYMYDPEFKNLVDSLLNLIKNCDFSSGELKQALTLAITIYEEIKPSLYFELPVDKETEIARIRTAKEWLKKKP